MHIHMCVFIGVCVYQRPVLGIISWALSILFFETGSPIGLDLTKQERLAGQSAPGVGLPLLLRCWDYKQAALGRGDRAFGKENLGLPLCQPLTALCCPPQQPSPRC